MNRLDYLAIEGMEDTSFLTEGFRENPPHPLGYSHFTYLKSALNYFKTGEAEPYLAIGKEALPSLELILGLYESAERGKPVNFPFKPKACKLGKGV